MDERRDTFQKNTMFTTNNCECKVIYMDTNTAYCYTQNKLQIILQHMQTLLQNHQVLQYACGNDLSLMNMYVAYNMYSP